MIKEGKASHCKGPSADQRNRPIKSRWAWILVNCRKLTCFTGCRGVLRTRNLQTVRCLEQTFTSFVIAVPSLKRNFAGRNVANSSSRDVEQTRGRRFLCWKLTTVVGPHRETMHAVATAVSRRTEFESEGTENVEVVGGLPVP